MKIVTTSKYYYEKSDIEKYLFNISNLLRTNKHEVVPFATKNEENLKTVYDIFFASTKSGYIQKNFLTSNPMVQKKLSLLLNTIQPDVIWNFGTNQELLPYILIEAKRSELQVVQTVSDSSIIKNKPTLFNKLLGQKPDPLENISIDKDLKYYSGNINTFIAPSQFLIKKMIKEGIPKEKIVHIPAFISTKNIEPKYESNKYFVYSGELTEENGISFLVKAMKEIPQHKLIILGKGALKPEVQYLIEKHNLKNISLIDSYSQSLKDEIIKNSRFCVTPSQWYTNSPNSILESYAAGKPVIASNIGGIKEYVADTYSGLLFDYNNPYELTSKIDYLMENPNITKEMGVFARSLAENCYNSEIHYYKIFNLLNTTILTHRELSKLSYRTAM